MSVGAASATPADNASNPRRADVAVGLIGGILSGLLGIGGGTIMVPLMVLWLGEAQRTAHALSLAAIIPISIGAIVVYGGAGRIEPLAALALTIGSVTGARYGAGLLARASERPLKAAFGVFLLLAAVLLVFEA